jgi:hypothetical protein
LKTWFTLVFFTFHCCHCQARRRAFSIDEA